jgi:hypothetical protein
MNTAIVSRTLSLIPDRVPRVQSGSAFDPRASSCACPERIAHLVQLLSWLGPLNPITRDDLRILGFGMPYGKPALLALEESEEETPAAAEPAPLIREEQEATLG